MSDAVPSRPADSPTLSTATTTTPPSLMQRSGGVLSSLLLLALFTLLITIVCRFALESFFQLQLYPDFWLRDYLGNLSVAFIAFALLQSRNKAMVLTAIVVIGFQMANGGKLSVLGTPVSPDDLINIKNLFYLTDGWRRYALMLLAALPLLSAIVLIPFKRKSAWATLAVFILAAFLINHFSEPLRGQFDRQFGNSVWNQPENFKRRGLALHIAQESIRTLAKVDKSPDRATVLAATQDLPNTASAGAQTPNRASSNRNVHVLVLESFFDPISLGKEWVPEDPFPDAFRELWAETDNSHALSPVFGGYTANAEFEVLCGFPVTENAVFFEGWLRRQVPCLPAVLANAGYQSIASHPNVPGFWNRTLAYKLVGFDTYLSKSSYNLSDSVGGLLLDHSFYDQTFSQLETLGSNRPTFNYMLTYHGHLPYPSNEHYPDKIKPGKESTLLNGYLNQLWYKSRDLMAQINTLRADDPEALIVVFGDHLPFLGPNYGVYSEVLGLPSDRADFTGDMLEFLVSTPLIVIDGQNGPLKLGKLPIYRLPALILDLLDMSEHKGMLAWTENPDDNIIRPVYGMHISVQNESTMTCPDDHEAPPSCAPSATWLSRTRLLIQDLFSGKQHSLNAPDDPLNSSSRQPLNGS